MNQINGNILDIKHGIICHQVNCRKVMGGGLALQIKNKWPHIYKNYIQNPQVLGTVHLGKATNNILVANLFGQDSNISDTKIVFRFLRRRSA